jgi:hypothetical protein
VLERADALRPLAIRLASPAISDEHKFKNLPQRRGKPVGSISIKWRTALANVYGSRFNLHMLIQAAISVGISANATSASERLRYFQQHNIVSVASDPYGYQVTEEAYNRFDLAKMVETPRV